MGGTIGVRSKLGSGSTFFFIVPLPLPSPLLLPTIAKSLSHKKSSPLTSTEDSPSKESLEALSVVTAGTEFSKSGHVASQRLGPVRALLVDDVTTNRKMVRRCMQQMGFECHEAVNGAEAVVMCQTDVFDVIIMDNVNTRVGWGAGFKHIIFFVFKRGWLLFFLFSRCHR